MGGGASDALDVVRRTWNTWRLGDDDKRCRTDGASAAESGDLWRATIPHFPCRSRAEQGNGGKTAFICRRFTMVNAYRPIIPALDTDHWPLEDIIITETAEKHRIRADAACGGVCFSYAGMMRGLYWHFWQRNSSFFADITYDKRSFGVRLSTPSYLDTKQSAPLRPGAEEQKSVFARNSYVALCMFVSVCVDLSSPKKHSFSSKWNLSTEQRKKWHRREAEVASRRGVRDALMINVPYVFRKQIWIIKVIKG